METTEKQKPNHTDSVRIVLFDEDDPNRFVIVSETDDPKNLKLPGGKFELGEDEDEIETAYQAAVREGRQELGLDPAEMNLEYAGALTNDDGTSRRDIFFGRTSLRSITYGEEIHEARSVTVAEIPEGKNKKHMLGAVALARRAAWEKRKLEAAPDLKRAA